MGEIFNIVLYQPILNALVLIYNWTPGQDFGVAIVILTIIIRLVFFPLSLKTMRSQRALAKLQPQLKELQTKHRDNKAELGHATMALYKEHQINPLSGCLPLLIQLPVLIALYRAFSLGLKPESLKQLYSFVHNPTVIKTISLGFINLEQPNPWLAVTAGVLQWWQARLSAKNQAAYSQGQTDSTTALMNKQMLYIFPIMVIIISWNLPTGLAIYWIVTTLFSILEQLYITKRQ